jgi:hypothetical protein
MLLFIIIVFPIYCNEVSISYKSSIKVLVIHKCIWDESVKIHEIYSHEKAIATCIQQAAFKTF